MAAQFSVAFSKEVKGVGVIAGGPYDCSQGDLSVAVTRCSCAQPPFCSTPTPSVLAFQSWNAATAKAGLNLVDPLTYLKSQRVWLFTGGKDATVPTPNVQALALFYIDKDKASVAHSQVHFQRLARAGHGMPVMNEPSGVACSLTAYPFINNCADDAAGDLLAWLYPDQPMANAPQGGSLIEFDQTAYTQGLDYTGLDVTGFVFVPSACAVTGAGCRLHVVFHGCNQARESGDGSGGHVDRLFAEHSGYNRWAAGSRIVVLYPQVMPHDTGDPWVAYQNNPQGCWDFWGYTRPFPSTGVFATNAAPQMLAVMKMIGALQRDR